MSQTTTPDGADHRDDVPVRRDTASEPCRVSGYLYGEDSTQLMPDGTFADEWSEVSRPC